MIYLFSTAWWAEAVMRGALIGFSVYNIAISFKPTIKFARGENMAPTIFYASIFFGNIAYFIFGVMFFVGMTSYSWTLLLLTLRLISSVLITFAYRTSIDRKIEQFYMLYDALPQALAMADLMKVDPVEGEKLAKEAARLCAVKIAGSKIRGE